MLKKILLISALFISIGWLATTGYISHQTQKQLSNPQVSLKNLQIIDYKKGFNRSQARFKFKAQTGNKSLNQLLHQIVFNADIKHGPILYSNNGIQLANSHWQVNAEQNSLPTNTQQTIERLFADNAPFKLNITFNFNQQGHYQLHIPQIILSEFKQRIGTIAPSHFSGKIDLTKKTINLEGKIGETNIKNTNGSLYIPITDVYADSDDNTLNIKRKANLRTEKITYKSDQLPNDIYFHLNLHIQQQLNDEDKNSSFDLSIHDAITPEQMIKAVNVKLNYKEKIQTAQHTLPAFTQKSMMHMLLQQLEQNYGSLTFSFNIIGEQGQIDLQAQADTHIIKQINKLKAQVALSADKKYIDSTPFTALLEPYIKRNVLLINDKKYQFNASIDGNKATLNGLEILGDVTAQQ